MAQGILASVPPASPQISVVIPCLNEEAAVGAVVDQAWEGIERSGRDGEVIVVDNGSTDDSARDRRRPRRDGRVRAAPRLRTGVSDGDRATRRASTS